MKFLIWTFSSVEGMVALSIVLAIAALGFGGGVAACEEWED